MMNVFVKEFPKQLDRALALAENISVTAKGQYRNIVIAGMGGSGIGADFVVEYLKLDANIPVSVIKSYKLPNFVNEHTLVIVSSFSGNTEEILYFFNEVIQTDAKIICLTSGGVLQEKALKANLDIVSLPNDENMPPRACFGYSFVQQIVIFVKIGFIKPTRLQELKAAVSMLKEQQEAIKQIAYSTAKQLTDKLITIYTCESFTPVGLRLRQQLNENAKLLAISNVFPEMNHNELVGWTKQGIDLAVVYLRHNLGFGRNLMRMDISKIILDKVTTSFFEIECTGDSLLAQMLYGVHFGDWLSVALAELREVDAVEVDSIDFLKQNLAVKTLFS